MSELGKSGLIGWDIGGAHLKMVALTPEGTVLGARETACPLWQGLDQLEKGLAEMKKNLGAGALHVLTMSGEMCDLFSSRKEGVVAIIEAFTRIFPKEKIYLYAGEGGFLSPEESRTCALAMASANWQASAGYCALKKEEGLLVDIGSTTTDIIPFARSSVQSEGKNDYERLRSGELVYTGLCRTPLMAMGKNVFFRKKEMPLMAELFATSADIHRLCGTLPETADSYPSADGAPKTAEASARRLARMIGCDFEDAGMEEWKALAQNFADIQRGEIRHACEKAALQAGLKKEAPLIGAGTGRFIVERLGMEMGRPYESFAGMIGGTQELAEKAAHCAPAFAVAALGLGALSP